MQPLKDASHLYEAEHRAYRAERDGFRISELEGAILQGMGEYDFAPLVGERTREAGA